MKRFKVKKKTVLINHTKSDYVCYWNDSQIYNVYDEITEKDLLIRTSPGTIFNADRQIREKFAIYWIYEDKPLFHYKKNRYFMTEFEKSRRGEMVYFKARQITPKSLKQFKLENPEFFI